MPPAIAIARAPIAIITGSADGPSTSAASRPLSRHDGRRLTHVLGELELGDVALRRAGALDAAYGAAQIQQPDRVIVGQKLPTRIFGPRQPICVLTGERNQRRGSTPATPDPPPMLTCSLPRVARATVQPLLVAHDVSSSGTNTSLKNTR